MIRLEATHLEWIKGSHDDPNDQCAHGRVLFHVNDHQFVKPGDGVWTLSASALYLLRSLTEDHAKDYSLAEWNFLFPCCGFCTWLGGKRFDVMCMGCASGIDVEIIHQSDRVLLRSVDGDESVSSLEWQSAVLEFASSIQDFYFNCSPKTEPTDQIDREGWIAFWQEWKERYSAARNSAC